MPEKLVKVDRPLEILAIVTLNDPDNLNAMSDEMAEQFEAAINALANDLRSGLRGVVVTGAGRAFSAGGDLEMLRKKGELSADENRSRMLKFYNSFLSILDLPVPVIAAINGHAIGAGLCLACACDIRIAATEAKLGFTFAKLGLFPGMGSTVIPQRILGLAKTLELFITARIFSAAEGERIGLVSEVMGPGELIARASAIVTELSACGPETVKKVLQSLRCDPKELTAGLEFEAKQQAASYGSDEFKEGVAAAIGKRGAKWGNGY